MHDDKGEEVLYQPAEALDILTIGELHSRLAQLGSDIDSDILSASEEWKSAILLYNDCIEKASKIRLKEL